MTLYITHSTQFHQFVWLLVPMYVEEVARIKVAKNKGAAYSLI